MSVQRSPGQAGKQTKGSRPRNILQFLRQESLRKTLVATVLAVSLIPVILVGTISYYRTRSQIQALVANQLYQISQNSTRQIQEFAAARQAVFANLIEDNAFRVTFETSINPEASAAESTAAIFGLRNLLVTTGLGVSASEPVFSQIFIADETGDVVASSDSQFINDNIGQGGQIKSPLIRSLLGKTSSLHAFNPFVTTRNGLVLLTSQALTLRSHTYTIIGVTPSLIYSRVLEQAVAFLPGARAFYRDANGTIYTSAESASLVKLPEYQPFDAAVIPVLSGANIQQPFTFDSYDGESVLAYAQNISEGSLSLILQVPTSKLFGQVPLLDRSILYVLLGTLLVLGSFGYIATSRMVNPLIQLSNIAGKFAEGKFDDRAKIRRNDEIGQLANSMNKMAEELNALYTNLEAQVETRTDQLRAAAEVAQLATSTSRLDEVLSKAANLIAERFGLYNVSLYLTDETRRFLILRDMSGPKNRDVLRDHTRIVINPATPSGYAAEFNQVRYLSSIEDEPAYLPDNYLPYTRSMIAIPIAVGAEVLGVMEAHSSQKDGFPHDLQFFLRTIANQVASAIQNMRLLETTQVDLEETSQLHKLTRLVAGAESEQVALNHVMDGLPQVPHVSAFLSVDGESHHIQALYDPRARKLERGLSTIDIPSRKTMEPLSQGAPIYLDDISQPSEFDGLLSFFLRRGCRSALILPCMRSGKPDKILMVGFYEGHTASQASLQPYINLAEVISATLDKFNLLRTLQQRLAELQVLANFSQATSAETHLQQLYRTLHQLVTDTLGDDIGFVLALHNPEKDRIEFPYAFEDQQKLDLDPLPVGNGLTSLIIESRKPLLLSNETERRAIELGARIIGRPAKSWLGVPLITGGLLIGALVIQDQDREERFSQDDLNLLMTLAPQIATAIRNAQLVEEMQAALKAYEQERLLLNTWLSNTPDAITVKDIHGTYLSVSQAVAQQLGSTVENLVGKSDFDIFPQEVASRIYSADREVMESGQCHFGDIEESYLPGVSTWHRVSRIPIRNQEGATSGLLSIRRDITDMVNAEAIARQRAGEIRTTAEIARDAAGILDLDELLNRAVNLIRDRFGFYHASVFLLDPLGEYAVLRESTGEAGRIMKANQHNLAVGSRSIVGQATEKGEAVVVPDVTQEVNYYPNPLLPNTKAETAIPLIFSGKVIGALDVQSDQANSFAAEDIEILKILADQLAATIHNAELFAAAQGMLGKHRLLHQINVAATSANNLEESLERTVEGLSIAKVAEKIGILLLNSRDELELVTYAGYEKHNLPQLRIPLGQGIIGAAAVERHPVRIDNVLNDPRYIEAEQDTRSELALPIVFGDDLIGVLNLEANQTAAFSENDQEIMGALANNLGAVIANWRLVERIRKQVDQQKMLYEVTSRIRRSVDIPTILQTSVNEIGRTMGVKRARITLLRPESDASGDTRLADNDIKKNGNNGNKESHR